MVFRSKCKLCQTIMTSERNSVMACKCGEITLDGVNNKIICEKSTSNYIEVDDLGNPIVEEKKNIECINEKPTTKQLLVMLKDMIESIERLPEHQLYTPVPYTDFVSSLLLVSALFNSLDNT